MDQPRHAKPCGTTSKMKQWFLLVILLIFKSVSLASCLTEEAAAYKLDPLLLKSISWVESRDNPKAVGPQLHDGNVALGKMQINTIRLPELKQYGITRDMLLDECTNIKIGAWALAKCISKFGPTGKALGCYNTGPASKNKEAQARYSMLVGDAYRQYQQNPQQRPNSKMRKAFQPEKLTPVAPATQFATLKQMRSWSATDDE